MVLGSSCAVAPVSIRVSPIRAVGLSRRTYAPSPEARSTRTSPTPTGRPQMECNPWGRGVDPIRAVWSNLCLQHCSGFRNNLGACHRHSFLRCLYDDGVDSLRSRKKGHARRFRGVLTARNKRSRRNDTETVVSLICGMNFPPAKEFAGRISECDLGGRLTRLTRFGRPRAGEPLYRRPP